MSNGVQIRLLVAFVALCAGVAAWVLVLLLLAGTL
jgi:hypothetical protein